MKPWKRKLGHACGICQCDCLDRPYHHPEFFFYYQATKETHPSLTSYRKTLNRKKTYRVSSASSRAPAARAASYLLVLPVWRQPIVLQQKFPRYPARPFKSNTKGNDDNIQTNTELANRTQRNRNGPHDTSDNPRENRPLSAFKKNIFPKPSIERMNFSHI